MTKLASLMALSLALVACGCKTTTFTQALPNGGTMTFKDVRWVFSTKASITATVNPTNGLQQIGVDLQSNPDAEFVRAAARGVAEGLGRVAPVP